MIPSSCHLLEEVVPRAFIELKINMARRKRKKILT